MRQSVVHIIHKASGENTVGIEHIEKALQFNYHPTKASLGRLHRLLGYQRPFWEHVLSDRCVEHYLIQAE